jgi:hypothetical protein
MAKAKKVPVKTQSQRMLEAAKAARAESGRNFSQAMAKVTMARQSRKTGKGQVDR